MIRITGFLEEVIFKTLAFISARAKLSSYRFPGPEKYSSTFPWVLSMKILAINNIKDVFI